ncbi:MAG: tetratricopeptide repeat protein, partial [Chloroflexi bacterium]|nr:tetratricopeptide repeat protein [Chloroflexota bacterium]
MLVTLPLVLLLLDAWPLGRLNATGTASGRPARARFGRLLLEKAPFLLLSAASCAVTLLTQRQVGAVQSLERYPIGLRLANAALSLWLYLRRLFWPTDLAVFYPHQGAELSLGSALAAVAFLAALSVWVFFQARRRPWLAVGWLWFLATMMPMIGVVQIGSQAMADRYAYLPLIGVVLALAWTCAELAPRAVFAVGAAATVLILGAATVAYSSFWKNSEILYRRTLAVTRGNWVIENNLGLALAAAGRAEEAVAHYWNALALRPSDPRLHNNCGVALR